MYCVRVIEQLWVQFDFIKYAYANTSWDIRQRLFHLFKDTSIVNDKRLPEWQNQWFHYITSYQNNIPWFRKWIAQAIYMTAVSYSERHLILNWPTEIGYIWRNDNSNLQCIGSEKRRMMVIIKYILTLLLLVFQIHLTFFHQQRTA